MLITLDKRNKKNERPELGWVGAYLKLLPFYFLLFTFLFASILPSYSYAKPKQKEQPKSDKTLSGKALFNAVWTKAKQTKPNEVEKGDKKAPKASVAGIRGKKKEGEYLKPYWKGDDKKAIEREAARNFQKASELIDKGDFEPAVASLKEFMAKYSGTTPEPNARVALGICLAQLDKKQEAEQELNKFVEKYPAHPLAEEAKKVIADLQKE